MLTAMQSDEFANRLRKVYVRILLRTHFEAVRQHWRQEQGQREERGRAVEALKKRAAIRFLREIVDRKKQKERK
jgi:hypothetical protein